MPCIAVLPVLCIMDKETVERWTAPHQTPRLLMPCPAYVIDPLCTRGPIGYRGLRGENGAHRRGGAAQCRLPFNRNGPYCVEYYSHSTTVGRDQVMVVSDGISRVDWLAYSPQALNITVCVNGAPYQHTRDAEAAGQHFCSSTNRQHSGQMNLHLSAWDVLTLRKDNPGTVMLSGMPNTFGMMITRYGGLPPSPPGRRPPELQPRAVGPPPPPLAAAPNPLPRVSRRTGSAVPSLVPRIFRRAGAAALSLQPPTPRHADPAASSLIPRIFHGDDLATLSVLPQIFREAAGGAQR